MLLHAALQHAHLILESLQVGKQVQHRVTGWRVWSGLLLLLLLQGQGARAASSVQQCCLC
jgi:hypothetical protein